MLTHFMVVYRKYKYNKLKLLFIITMNAPAPTLTFGVFNLQLYIVRVSWY